MPTSTRWEVANSPQISVKPVHSAGPMWASAPTVKLAAAFEFADSFCFTRLPAARPLRRAAFLFSLYNRGGVCYNIKDYDRVKTLTKVFVIAATVLSLIFYIPAELFPAKVLSMFITTPGVAASGATNFRIMFSTYVLQGSFMIAVTLFQSLGKANKATWLVLFRQIILFIPLCVLLPMIGGMGIRGVWLAIALTDAILVVITISMMISEFRKMPSTVMAKR